MKDLEKYSNKCSLSIVILITSIILVSVIVTLAVLDRIGIFAILMGLLLLCGTAAILICLVISIKKIIGMLLIVTAFILAIFNLTISSLITAIAFAVYVLY